MKNSKLRRALLLLASAVLLVSLSVGATLAYLTSTTDTVVNTFTVGNVNIKLDEAQVDYVEAENKYVEKTDGSRTEVGNQYKILPGVVIAKDPTVTVLATSEKCYVRALITVESNQLADKLMDGAALNWVKEFSDEWTVYGITIVTDDPIVYEEDGKTVKDPGKVVRVYEVRYNSIVNAADGDVKLDDIFERIEVPGEIDETAVQNLASVKIDVVAHAIQSNGFEGAVDKAWEAFDGQND